MKTLDRSRLSTLMAREKETFSRDRPRSKALFADAQRALLAGVPMQWMTRWPGAFPVFVAEARGARLRDVDGIEYIDLCLGDTGAMTGHSPEPTARAVERQARRGFTTMLPNEDAIWVGDELQRRFGMTYWQFTLSATDANRCVIRLARQISGRPKILVYNRCYHGTVDETFITLRDGEAVASDGNVGPPCDPALTTRVVEWNDLEALERELAHNDVACVLAEPALTNVGIVLPDPEYHEALRALTRKYGTLLIIDETHTFCAGHGGYTRVYGLEPDMMTMGKAMGGGVPCGAYGLSQEVATRAQQYFSLETADTGGVGGTLAANALSLAAMHATLDEVLTEEAFATMIALGARYEQGVNSVIAEHDIPWHSVRIGCRVEYLFVRERPRNGGQAAAAMDHELDAFMHLYALNRGILLTPFHLMALMSPTLTEADVDAHTAVFRSAVEELFGR
jgi:glutamate-1-semialdehyde 2,1-aminomutase